ncbi:hypothetical protein VPHD290_0072 [Vibrio phage D290]
MKYLCKVNGVVAPNAICGSISVNGKSECKAHGQTKCQFKVELENKNQAGLVVKIGNYWLDGNDGDPGRTLVESSSKKYKSLHAARCAYVWNEKQYGDIRDMESDVNIYEVKPEGCVFCGDDVTVEASYEIERCCGGGMQSECGCMGMPTNPVFCDKCAKEHFGPKDDTNEIQR